MSELQAVLFDMDGTICDSEPSWMASERAMAARYGAEWTDDDALHLVGFALMDGGTYIKQRMGLPQSPADVVDELVAGVMESLARDGVAWRPGALELLQACNDAGVPTALVTMSYRDFCGAVLAVMPHGRFDVVVTGDEVDRGKPAPDPYLAAARQLGVDPACCVAIEDSPTGAASAQAAGCLTVVVPNHVEVPLTDGMLSRSSVGDLTVEELRRLMATKG